MGRAGRLLFGLAAFAAGGPGPLRGRRDVGLARLRAAVESGDATSLYAIVDDETRWSIDGAFRFHQLSLEVIEESYPPEVQPRTKARFVDAEDVRKFLVAYDARYHLLAGLKS